MEKIKEMLARPLIAAAAGFVLGLIIGLPILGWWLLPVTWTEASPEHLRMDVKEDYLKMAIQSYTLNKDGALAAKRFSDLGPDAKDVFAKVSVDPALNPSDVIAFGSAVQAAPVPAAAAGKPTTAAGATAPAQAAPTVPGVITTAVPETTAKKGTSPFVLLGVFCLLTLIIGGALVYVLIFRKRGFTINRPSQMGMAGPSTREAQRVEYPVEAQETPIAQFMTTYVVGDDLYDDSFSIDSPSGEFLGECGVGISDTIGVGDPKKVTAFELWLFDKNDIQTVTKVLMSEHAFTDTAIRQRLVSKGEPVLVKPNEHILLETATLQLEARVVEMAYGQGALPSGSFFERITLELAVWPK